MLQVGTMLEVERSYKWKSQGTARNSGTERDKGRNRETDRQKMGVGREWACEGRARWRGGRLRLGSGWKTSGKNETLKAKLGLGGGKLRAFSCLLVAKLPTRV